MSTEHEPKHIMDDDGFERIEAPKGRTRPKGAVLELIYPIKGIKGSEITELKLPRPNSGKLIDAIDGVSETRQVFSLAEALSGHPEELLRQLDPEDLGRLQEVLQGFLGSLGRTGDGNAVASSTTATPAPAK